MTLRRLSRRKFRVGYDREKHIQWRQDVLRRDKRVCQFPGCCSKVKLQAHHIRRWADYPAIRYDVNNGITLCKYHHEFIKDKEVMYAPIFQTKIVNKLNEKRNRVRGNKRH